MLKRWRRLRLVQKVRSFICSTLVLFEITRIKANFKNLIITISTNKCVFELAMDDDGKRNNPRHLKKS